MDNQSLFGDALAVPFSELPETASAWDRLARTEGQSADRIRETLQSWWGAMPPAARAQIRDRLADKDLGSHLGAFWEVYLHRMFTGLGFDVQVDIGRDQDENLRHPDFRVSRGDIRLGIEATAVLGEDTVDRTARARVQQLYAAIEKIRNRRFFLSLALRSVGPNTPGAKLASQIDRWLNTLDADSELERRQRGQAPTETTISHAGWELTVSALPRKPELRGRPDLRIIGSKQEGWETHRFVGERTIEVEGYKRFDEVRPLTKGLRSKAGHRYEVNGEPFVLAVLCGGLFAGKREIAQALLGECRYSIPAGDGAWQGNGLWLDDRCEPRNRTVSGVLTVSGLVPASSAVSQPRLWTSPWARRPLAADALPWQQFNIQPDGRIGEVAAGATAAAVLGLPDRWPAQPD